MLKSGGSFSNGFWLCLTLCAAACAGERTTFEDDGKKTDDALESDGGSSSGDSGLKESDPNKTTTTGASDPNPTSSDLDPTSPTADRDPTTDPSSTVSPAVDCEPNETQSCAEGGLLGNCAGGEQTCGDDGKFGPCSIVPASADKCTPDDDADCDGKVNEDCSCMNGEERPCSEDGFKGTCAEGVELCAEGAWGDCSVEPENDDDCSQPGNDADCDGTPNSGCSCTEDQACGPEAVGICQPGVSACVDGAYADCEGAVEAEPRDCSSSEDNDCDGELDNTLDDECECEPGMERACDEHEDLDGKGDCTAGIQTCELGADGATSAWGDCVGAIGPAGPDSCVPGNDNDCDGEENEDCACTAQADCNDNKTCTTDVCDEGECSNEVSAGFCLIGGQCIPNNQADSVNSCRYCNAAMNPTGWTDSSNGASCDDGLWCNGTDSCNGSGTCNHEFVSGNRCTGSDDCISDTCDENLDTCFLPSSTVCSDEPETVCQNNNTCGSVVRTRQVQQHCTGTSGACTGMVEEGDWQDTACSADENCSGAGVCTPDLEKCAAFCDDDSELCWAQTWSERGTWEAGNTFCETLDFGGSDKWHLPTLAEWITAMRGCQNGTTGDANDETQCTWVSNQTLMQNCNGCPAGDGPDDDSEGCYWNVELDGPCDDYWSTSVSLPANWPMSVYADTGSGAGNQASWNGVRARCILRYDDRP